MDDPQQQPKRDILFKAIDITQDVIRRMAQNSFHIKTWTVTLVAATLLLRGGGAQVFIAFIPLFVFWYLDAYFLRLERVYRKIYETIIRDQPESVPEALNMDPRQFMKNSGAQADKNAVASEWKIMLSKTLLIFYGAIFLMTAIYAISLFFAADGFQLQNSHHSG